MQGGFRTIFGVFKITPQKEISTVIQFSAGSPGALAFDPQGKLLFFEVHRPEFGSLGNISPLRQISPDGTLRALDSFDLPTGLAVTNAGRIFVSQANNRVIEFIATGAARPLIAGAPPGGFSGDGGPANQAKLQNPGGISVDSQGRLWIADSGNRRVRMVDTNGIITTELELPFATPPGITFSHPFLTMPLVTTETQVLALNGTVIAGNGTLGFSGDGGLATAAQLDKIGGLAIDSKGLLYISDTANNRIRIVNPKRGAGTPFIR